MQECAYVYFLSKASGKVIKNLSYNDTMIYMERKLDELANLTNYEYKPALEVALHRVMLRQGAIDSWEYGMYAENPMQKATILGIECIIKYASVELDNSKVIAKLVYMMYQ